MLKNKILLIFGLFLMFTFLVVGCKSDPETPPTETPVEEVPPVEPTPEPEPVVEPEPEISQEPSVSEEELLANAKKAAENATSMKDKIEELSFASYDESSYNEGLLALEKYNSLIEEGKAQEKLDNAILAEKEFKEVLDKAYSKLASEKKSEVIQIREKALEIKSQKADKVGYDAAQLLFTTAEASTATKEYEMAYNYYVKAKDAFNDVYNNVSAKRAAALEAIERAKNKAADVDTFAAEADKIAPLSQEEANQEAE